VVIVVIQGSVVVVYVVVYDIGACTSRLELLGETSAKSAHDDAADSVADMDTEEEETDRVVDAKPKEEYREHILKYMLLSQSQIQVLGLSLLPATQSHSVLLYQRASKFLDFWQHW
jgi:hypothetical protein